MDETKTNENKVLVAYTITRYANGDINIENAEVEGAEKLGNEALYKDVEDVADMIRYKRIENASYRGISRFYADVAARQTDEPTAEPTIE